MRINIEILVFKVGKAILGVNIREIKEVLGESKIYPLPNVSEIILGNINVRGTIWVLLDLKKILLNEVNSDSKKKYFLLTKDSENKVAFLCDEIIDILDITPGEIQRIENSDKKAKSFFLGQVYYNNRIIPIINLKKITQTSLDKLSEINFEEIIR